LANRAAWSTGPMAGKSCSMGDEIDYTHTCSSCLEVIYAAGKRGLKTSQNILLGLAADKGDYINAC
jgi:hypothetical protein